MMWVATIGVVINGSSALLFLRGRHRDLNIRGAFLHLAWDAAITLGVFIAGAATALTGWTWLDAAVSLGIGVAIVVGTWGLLRSSVNPALDAVPEGIDLEQVRQYLAGLPAIAGVHDLHVWGMSTTEAALTVQLVSTELHRDALLRRIATDLHDRFGIEHSAVQIESEARMLACGCPFPDAQR